MGQKMEQTAIEGVSKLYEWGGIVTVLMLVIIGLCWLCHQLMKRNTELADRLAAVVEKNTEAFISLKEVMNHANR